MTHLNHPNRREMIELIAGLAGMAALGGVPGTTAAAEPASAPAEPAKKVVDPLVGIQIAPHSLLDEGVDYCLDLLKEQAAVNAPMLSPYGWYGAMGRPLAVMADHGVPRQDNSRRRLPISFVTHRDKFFEGTSLRHAAEDVKGEWRDILKECVEPIRKRGMKLYLRIYEPGASALKKHIINGEKVLERSAEDKPLDKPCLNHPEFRAWIVGTVADLFDQYPIDGLQYGAERSGPLGRLFHWGSLAACFCAHCQKRARDIGIDPERARIGYAQLHAYLDGLRKDTVAPPPEGAFVGALRIFLAYPEIFAWERQWHLAQAEVHELIRQTGKKLRPNAEIGRHISHVEWGMDLFYRAAMSVREMAGHTDFVKFIGYHEIFGPRLRQWCIEPWAKTILKGMSMEEVLALFYKLAGHDPTKNPTFDRLDDGLGAEYVWRETKRGVDGAQGKVKIYTGIGTDIPTGSGWGTKPWASDPEVLYQCVRRSFEAGAAGIVISREYEENRLESLKTIGKAVRDAVSRR